MSHNRSSERNKVFIITGLGVALLIAVFLSPFASSNPDGLDRVSKDHKFDTKANSEPLAHKLPFYSIFKEYELRGVPKEVATPLAGLVGTLAAFGIAWGLGKLVVRGSTSPDVPSSDLSDDT